MWGLPWWPSGWEPACQFRGRRFDLSSGKIPHAVEQPSPRVRAPEPTATTSEADKRRPHAPQREKPRQWETSAKQRRPYVAKNKTK